MFTGEHYHTIKQRKFKTAIKHSKTKAEAARKAGYSPRSKTIYQQQNRTDSIIREALREDNEDKIKSDFSLMKEKCLAEGDNANFLRANEDLAKIRAMFTDKQIIDANIVNKEEQSIVDKYISSNRLPSES